MSLGKRWELEVFVTLKWRKYSQMRDFSLNATMVNSRPSTPPGNELSPRLCSHRDEGLERIIVGSAGRAEEPNLCDK